MAKASASSSLGREISRRPNGVDPGQDPAPGDRREDLLHFLSGGLAASRDAIEQTLAIQQRMMDVVSRVAFAPDGARESGRASQDVDSLVTALQSDDLIRQTHENLLRALAVMARVVEEESGQAGCGAADPAGRTRWKSELLDSLLLEDLRECFARRLDGPDSGS